MFLLCVDVATHVIIYFSLLETFQLFVPRWAEALNSSSRCRGLWLSWGKFPYQGPWNRFHSSERLSVVWLLQHQYRPIKRIYGKRKCRHCVFLGLHTRLWEPLLSVTRDYKVCALVLFIAHYIQSVCHQPSSTLSSYVSACAYSPTNQYGVYGGSAGGYVAPGHHHWQPQSPALSHAGSGMGMHAGEIHSTMAFKHQQAREGTKRGGRVLTDVSTKIIYWKMYYYYCYDFTIFYYLTSFPRRPAVFAISPSLSHAHTLAISSDRDECKHLPNPKWTLIICQLLNIDLTILARVRPARWSEDILAHI